MDGWKQQGGTGQQAPNRGGGGWNDPGMGGAQQGDGMGEQGGGEDRLRPLREAAAGIDPREAKAQVERMVASGRAPRPLVEALYAGAKAMMA